MDEEKPSSSNLPGHEEAISLSSTGDKQNVALPEDKKESILDELPVSALPNQWTINEPIDLENNKDLADGEEKRKRRVRIPKIRRISPDQQKPKGSLAIPQKE